MPGTGIPGPFGFGDLLDAAFGIYRRHFLTLFATTLLLMMPFMAVGWFALPNPTATVPADPAQFAADAFARLGLYGLTALVFVSVLWGGLTRQTSQALLQGAVSIGDGIGKGFRSLFRLIVAFLVSVIALYAGMIVLVLVGAVIMGVIITLAGAEQGVMTAVTFGIAGIGAFAGMLFWGASFFALAPAVVVEGLGPFAAIKRSWTLSNGGRLRILGILIVTWFILILPSIAVVMAAGLVGAMRPEAFLQPGAGQQALIQALNFGVSALTLPFFVAVIVALYYDRRARTEAPGTGEATVDEFAPAY